MKDIKLSLLSYQIQFIQKQKDALYCAFVGGVGSGKSYTLAVGAFLDALHSPHALIGIYGPTIAHVRDVCMAYILNLLTKHGFMKDKDYFVNKNEMKITSNHNQIGSFVFKSMDDPSTIIGYQTYTAHVDELDTMAEDKAEQAWHAIQARTRQWPEGLDSSVMAWDKDTKTYEPRNKICAYTTPEGFKFTYKTWGKNIEGTETYDPEYQIIKGKTRDNPFNASSYFKNMLKKYPGPLAKAYLEGDFVNLQSGTVYYAFNREVHDSDEEIKPGETLFIGMDFNVGKMAACVFVKRQGGLEWHCVEELTDVLDTPNLIEIIKNRWQSKGHQITVYPDSTGKNRNASNASESSIAQLRDAGFLVRAKTKNPFVTDRISAINRGYSEAWLFINTEKCPITTECQEQQAYDKNGKPNKDSGHDHSNDAFGYPIAYERPLRKKLFSVPIRWAI